MDQFRRLVKDELRERGWSVCDLAQRCSMSYGALYDILGGRKSPTLKTCERIARGLGFELKISK